MEPRITRDGCGKDIGEIRALLKKYNLSKRERFI